MATYNYVFTSSQTSITAQVGTTATIKLTLTNNGSPLANQPIQSILSGLIQGGSVINTDANGVAVLPITCSSVGNVNCDFVCFEPTGVKHQVSVVVSFVQSIPQPDPTRLWHVQLGAFSNKTNAENLAAELKAKGYTPYLVQYYSVNN